MFRNGARFIPLPAVKRSRPRVPVLGLFGLFIGSCLRLSSLLLFVSSHHHIGSHFDSVLLSSVETFLFLVHSSSASVSHASSLLFLTTSLDSGHTLHTTTTTTNYQPPNQLLLYRFTLTLPLFLFPSCICLAVLHGSFSGRFVCFSRRSDSVLCLIRS